MNRLAVFDCDGTLVDSQHGICAAMTACFEGEGLEPPSTERTRRIVGLSLPEAMADLLPDRDEIFHRRLAEAYKACFVRLRSEGMAPDPLYEGVSELIPALAAAGWQLAIATGKSDRGLSYCLDAHDLAGHFTSLQTADRHPSKPHPSMLLAAMAEARVPAASTVMIGDTIYDVEMANKAGVKAIGVAWGYHRPDELEAAGASAVAASVDELQRMLETY